MLNSKKYSIPAALLILTLWNVACGDEDSNPIAADCAMNIDCAADEICVAGVCTADTADCAPLGAFEHAASLDPAAGFEQIFEYHVAFDSKGAAHYCLFGVRDDAYESLYGYQVSSTETAEFPVRDADDNPADCSALTIDSRGTAYLLSRREASLLRHDGDGAWTEFDLPGFSDDEARGSLRSVETVVDLSLVDDVPYLALSMGFQVERQSVYVARLVDEDVELLANGWNEYDVPTFYGHAPQVIADFAGDWQMVMGDLWGFAVDVYNTDLHRTSTIAGSFPRAAVTSDGQTFVTYMDEDYLIHVGTLEDGELNKIATIEDLPVGILRSTQVPWDLTVDGAGDVHLLSEYPTDGGVWLNYRTVAEDGTVGESQLLDSLIGPTLQGGQLWDLAVDSCGRATIAIIGEQASESDGGYSPLIEIVVNR